MSEVPHDVRGSSLEIEILLFHLGVQQVLRALPAETKVDGLPRASSYVGKMDSEQYQGETICTFGMVI